MVKVRFYRGTKEKYDSETYKDGLYFTTDTKEIYLNGKSYGISTCNLSCVITCSDDVVIYQGEEYTVTWTLTCKYNDQLIDLDEVPEGWTQDSTGVYTKTDTITESTGSSISSGDVVCTYADYDITATSASCDIVIPSYIFFSDSEELDDSQLASGITGNGIEINIDNTNTILDDVTFTVPEDGMYVYFAISSTSSISDVLQSKFSYLSTDDTFPQSLTRENYGTYTVYRSANSMSAGEQQVTIISENSISSSSSYILYSSDESLTEETLILLICNNGTVIGSSGTIAGDYIITVPENGNYVYFAIAETASLNSVTQIGMNYLSTDETFPQTITISNCGTYTVYRSANAMSAGNQLITIA